MFLGLSFSQLAELSNYVLSRLFWIKYWACWLHFLLTNLLWKTMCRKYKIPWLKIPSGTKSLGSKSLLGTIPSRLSSCSKIRGCELKVEQNCLDGCSILCILITFTEIDLGFLERQHFFGSVKKTFAHLFASFSISPESLTSSKNVWEQGKKKKIF